MDRQRDFDYRSMRFEYPPCPICASRRFEPLLDIDRYKMGVETAGCTHCGLVMTWPMPVEEDLADFYELYYRHFYQSVDRPDSSYIQRYHKDERAAYTAGFLQAQGVLTPGSRVLDFGCAEGSLLAALRGQCEDLKLVGIEPNPDFTQFAREFLNAPVFETLATLDANAPSLQFDLILINHVLEHLREPVLFLKNLRERLAPGGLLFIDVPALERYESIQSIHLAHLYHFSGRTLEAACAKSGFGVSLLEQHDPPHHPPSLRVLVEPNGAYGDAVVVQEGDWHWERIRLLGKTAWRYFLTRNPVIRMGLYLPRRLLRLFDRG